MEREQAKRLVTYYVQGWKDSNPALILSTLAPDCLIIESHGPTYRGIEHVKQWVDVWFAHGGIVNQWEITSFYCEGSTATFEWAFDCTVDGDRYTFEGCSVVHFDAAHIRSIREYRMTDPAYDWEWIE
jgi:hypothetical protein